MSDRAYHRPISVRVEKIGRLPDVKTLPYETEMTINLKYDRKSRREMILFLMKDEFLEEPPEYTFVEITGPSP